jgi:hypothetical protein
LLEQARELDQVMRERFPGELLAVPHRTWAVTAKKAA